MAKLPPRRTLRSIVQDAISDREEFDDATIATQTSDIIVRYNAFLPRLADDAPPLSPDDINLLASACMHARIWREGYVDSWIATGEKAIILKARQDVDRVTRTEEALGVVRHWSRGGPMPEGMRNVPLTEIMARSIPNGAFSGGDGWTVTNDLPAMFSQNP